MLRHNLAVISGWMNSHNASWTVVTKVLCGHAETINALQLMGVRSIGDSRLENIRIIERIVPEFETWYLRIPDLSSVPHVAALSDVSLNSELGTIRALNDEARGRKTTHRIVIMIELGDLREGILPGSLLQFYEDVLSLSNIRVLGIGANLGCLAGVVPSIDQFTQLALYRELLELKFGCRLPIISAGSSVVLPLLLNGELPAAINHFRIGEAIFLGTDLVNGGTLPGLRDDAILLDAEIAEIKEKGLVPMGETAATQPFQSETTAGNDDIPPGARGYRALITIGQLDTDISGLTPVNPSYSIAGASSDVTVVNLGDDPDGLHVGDTLTFRVNYSALLRLMGSRYISKRVTPSIREFSDQSISHAPNLFPVLPEGGCPASTSDPAT